MKNKNKSVKCGNCGVEVTASAVFCPECGEKLNCDSTDSNRGPDDTLARRRRIICIVAFCTAAVLALLLAITWFFRGQLHESAYEEQHRKYSVEINADIPGYDSATSSPIPLLVSGEDFEGNLFDDRILFVDNETTPVWLMRGHYEIAVASSPILSDGTIFSVEGASCSVEIAGNVDGGSYQMDGEKAATFESSNESMPEGNRDADTMDAWEKAVSQRTELEENVSGVVATTCLTLIPIDALQVTDEEIQFAFDGLVEFGEDEVKANEFRALAETRRQIAIDEKAVSDRAFNKAQFEEAFDDLERREASDPAMAGSAMEMAETSEKYYVEYASLMNGIIEYLIDILPSSELAVVEKQQSEIESQLSAVPAKVQQEMGGGSGFMASAYVNSDRISIVKVRIKELISLIA